MRLVSALSLLTGIAVTATTAAAAPPDAASVAAHVEAARRLAGTDLTPLMGLCRPVAAERSGLAVVAKVVQDNMARPAPPPGKAFDNLAYVGANWVSAWAISTSDGIVMVDALNTETEAKAQIEGGLRALQMDPARIRQVLVTHAHGDHYGGAPYLKTAYGAHIVMSETDWRMTEMQLEFAIPLWLPPPKRDVALKDGDTIRQGDTTITVYETPGHTLGTLTPVFEVRDGDQRHRALVWGGTSFNFGRDLARLDAYIASTQRMAQLAESLKIDVMLSNHSAYDATVAKLAALKNRAPGAPNPFVIGTPAVVRSLQAMGECAQAQRDRFLIGS